MAPSLSHSLNDGLSSNAGGAVPWRTARGMLLDHQTLRPDVPGARREAAPVLLLPDADEPQLPFTAPTQYRYALIRPLVLFQDRVVFQKWR